jgi:hypothetical protein
MKITTLFAVSALAAGFSGAAMADDFTEWCIANAPAGVDAAEREATCSCLAAATDGDDAARMSMQEADDIADREERFAALSDGAKEAVTSCR